MLRPTRPPIDPLAQRAAIDALEAQRAAYRRYARAMEVQQRTLHAGDGEQAAVAAEAAVRGFEALRTGAERLQPLVGRVQEGGTPEQLVELQRHMEELMREARLAEAAIQNMTVQLEAWRDAYGRQLAELGIVPGGEAERTPDGSAAGYGPPGGGGRRTAGGVPSLIDRRG